MYNMLNIKSLLVFLELCCFLQCRPNKTIRSNVQGLLLTRYSLFSKSLRLCYCMLS